MTHTRLSPSPDVGALSSIRNPNTSLIMTLSEFRVVHRNGWWRKNNGKKAIIIPPGMLLDQTLVLVTPIVEHIPDFRSTPGLIPNHIPVIKNGINGIHLSLMCISEQIPCQITVDWEGCCAELMLYTDEIPESCCVISVDDQPISVVFVG